MLLKLLGRGYDWLRDAHGNWSGAILFYSRDRESLPSILRCHSLRIFFIHSFKPVDLILLFGLRS